MNLNQKNFALSAGIIWATSILLMTLISLATGYATDFLNGLANLYPGYSISYLGSLIGFTYGFVDVFLAFYIFAALYNWLGRKK